MKNRKRFAAVGLAAALALSISACGTSGEQTQPETQSENAAGETDGTTDSKETESTGNHSGGGNVLVAYFTAAENSGVDAEASASYSTVDGVAKGRVQAIAEMIQAGAGGDLFSIQTDVVYPSDGGELIDYASEEQAENARPELTSQIENLDDYDTVFVGYPIWWYDIPQVMYSFFDEYDFSGKTIIPFCVHNGSRFSGTIENIRKLEPDATVVEDGFSVNERDVADAEADVNTWLEKLGY